MTETSSLVTVNTTGKLESAGKLLAYFEVRAADEKGEPFPVNICGEILVRSKQPGLIIKEYFRNPDATCR
jgi:crotonobetaine/carnitine-CoA ligase